METLEQQVLNGLSATEKYLPSTFFYDEIGSAIYQQITSCEDYYLIRSEIEALENHKTDIIENFDVAEDLFELIDLGAGDAMKTDILIKECLKQQRKITYVPVDISLKFINDIRERFKSSKLNLRPVVGNYFDVLPSLQSNTRKVFAFMGANIGNFTPQEAIRFLKNIRRIMHPRDSLLLSCDLIKDPKIILQAYNDRHLYTQKFNLNMLERLNREFGGDINVDNFIHYPIFDPLEPGAKSFLISKLDQIVHLKKYNKVVTFHKWEHIHTETSRKYTLPGVAYLSNCAGLKVNHHFFCNQRGYVLALLGPDEHVFAQENQNNFMTKV